MITSVEKGSPRGSIDRKLLRVCLEAIELDKKQFFEERKNTKMNATSKLLNHKSNQHFKLSKTLSTRKCKVFIDPKHTH